MQPLFNVPGEGGYAFIMGIISGYPVGAKIVSDFYENKVCTKNEAERLLAFTNNSGPLFIIGTVGILLFGNSNIGILLFFTHLLSSITVGIILGIISRHCNTTKNNTTATKYMVSKNTSQQINSSLSDLGNILSTSISKSISTVLQIGGFVVLFSVILSILNKLNIIDFFSTIFNYIHIPKEISKSLISGILELTNGVSLASNLHTKNISINIILCAFLLGFGGFSVLLQVLGIISKVGLSIKNYFYGKLLQGLIASLYTSIFIEKVPFFKLDLPTYSDSINYNYVSIFLLFLIIISICFIFLNSKFRNKKTSSSYSLIN